MRARDGASFVVFVFTAIALAVAGCTGAARTPQGNQAVGKPPRAATADNLRPAPDSAEPAAQASADEHDTPSAANEAVELASDAATVEAWSEGEPAPQQVTALRPPTVRPAVMPEVVLSKAHADDCLVRVGDEFPEFRLPDLMGRMQAIGDVQGDALTVVVFWSGDRLLAADQLRYLDQHIARYADLGVKAVAINVGEAPELVRGTIEELGHAVPVLLDLERRLFSQVGKGHLPRTYLLDRDGHVLWFDIEFSRHTRDQLEQAIHATLSST